MRKLGRVWSPNWMKMIWRQRRTVLMIRIASGLKKTEDRELSLMNPRHRRMRTVRMRLTK